MGFLPAGVSVLHGGTGQEILEVELVELTIDKLQEGYKEGNFSIVDIVQAYLDRIEKIDKSGPSLNSIIELNPDALEIAKGLDKSYAKKNLGAMHGVPVLLKDNIDTHDKMQCTAGSKALLGSMPLEDSWVAQKLRAAGAIILGKTNLSDWANFRSDLSSSGWSGVGGQTKNPYRLDRNPCGSSAGSGAAVSASLCMVAIGAEANGSSVCPSQANGVVGIKPTVGLVGRSGIVPISVTQDTAGPMARTVADAVHCLSVLTGVDPKDEKTNDSADKVVDYVQSLNKDGLKGKKIARYMKSSNFHPDVDVLMEKAIATMKKEGAEIVELEKINLQSISKESFDVLLFEFKDGLNKYFSSLGPNAKIKSLKELIAFNAKDETESMFDQKTLKLAEAKGSLESEEYQEALRQMLLHSRGLGIDRVMEDLGLDAIIAPTGSPAWKTDLTNGDHYLGGSSSPAARAGYPNITVPMGFVDELPVGISIFGQAWTEAKLIEIAYAFEQASMARQAPNYLEH